MDYYKEVLIKTETHRARRKCITFKELSTFYEHAEFEYPWKAIGQMTYSDKQMNGAVEFDFWIDIDADNKGKQGTINNLEASSPNCRILLEYLSSTLSIYSHEVRIFFSGNGGFHLLLPFRLDREYSGSELLNQVRQTVQLFQKEMSSGWQVGSHIDLQLYSMKGTIRLPWSKHESGLRKVPLTPDELCLPPHELLAIIREKSDAFAGNYDFQWLNEKQCDTSLVELVCRRRSPILCSAPSSDGISSIWGKVLTDIGDDAPCVEEIGRFRLPLHNFAKFNLPKMFLLSHLKRLGYPLEISTEIVTAWADEYSRRARSTAQKSRERRHDVESAARTIFRSLPGSNYDFSINGTCVRHLSNMMPKAIAKPCETRNCRHRCTVPWREPTRIGIQKLIKQCGTPIKFWIYIHIALNDQGVKLSKLVKELGQSRNTIRASIKSLERDGLLVEEVGKSGRVWLAKKSIRKSIMIKN